VNLVKSEILNRYISERTAQDLFDLQEYIDSLEEQTTPQNLFISAVIVKQSLKAAYSNLPLWKRLFSYFKYHKSERWIMKKLSMIELNKICEEVFSLEGVDINEVKKKSKDNEYQETTAKG